MSSGGNSSPHPNGESLLENMLDKQIDGMCVGRGVLVYSDIVI